MRRIALLVIPALLLAGCAAAPAADDGRVRVVASTNVYGSIVDAIGGNLVSVTNLIDSAAQDPHSFEASAQNQLAVSKADLVIENGGGYDDFVDTLLDAASSDAVVLNVSERIDLEDGRNEHLWYEVNVMAAVAYELAAEFALLDPDNAALYQENATAFSNQLIPLNDRLYALFEQNQGRTVMVTEPVPLYLLGLAGYTNVTPDEFTEAIEEGTDVPPAVLKRTLALITSETDLLAYNSQTASRETEQLREAAEEAGVPVVEFTETLPDGETYLSWMSGNIAALEDV